MNSLDHKSLGRQLKIFHFSDQVGRGLPLWLPNGSVIREELERFLKELEFRAGYGRVHSPHVAREQLYVDSGHLAYFQEGMYPAIKVDEGEVYRLRPMNCPHHHMVFSSEPRSYRDLPLRLAEFGQVYRLEPSGSLSGLMRVRGLCQNDAHIYCSKEQVKAEFRACLEMHFAVYEKLQLKDFSLRLSLQSKNQVEGDGAVKFVDDPEAWAWSEALLRDLLNEMSLPFVEAPGEAAFYGPKVDIQMKAHSGREESFSSVQLDFSSAARMDLSYVAAGGAAERPYVIHRAPLGSHERLVAFLLERHQGWFPSWLAPVQVRVLPVSKYQAGSSFQLVERLRSLGIRAELAAPEESLDHRIRRGFEDRVPNLAVIGRREIENGSVMLRRGRSSEQCEVPRDEFVAQLLALQESREFDVA